MNKHKKNVFLWSISFSRQNMLLFAHFGWTGDVHPDSAIGLPSFLSLHSTDGSALLFFSFVTRTGLRQNTDRIICLLAIEGC